METGCGETGCSGAPVAASQKKRHGSMARAHPSLNSADALRARFVGAVRGVLPCAVFPLTRRTTHFRLEFARLSWLATAHLQVSSSPVSFQRSQFLVAPLHNPLQHPQPCRSRQRWSSALTHRSRGIGAAYALAE
jgi:hypothetical protein